MPRTTDGRADRGTRTAVGLGVLLAACTPPTEVAFECDTYACVPEAPLAAGDPEVGRDRVLNRGTSSCALPYSAIEIVPAAFDGPTLPGRTGLNAGVPYNFTVGVSPRGVDVLGNSCLGCHASVIDGEVVVGPANPFGLSEARGDLMDFGRRLLDDPEEIAEVDANREMVALLDQYLPTTIGANRGDTALFLMALHRDPFTLDWLDEPLDTLPASPPTPIDPPPWWGMKKKRAMFWNTAARGDYSHFVLNGILVCADDVDWAEAVFADAPDVRAWVESIEAPPWPYDLDEALAADGEQVFLETCARCHGTYGEDGTYPNVVVPVGDVGTDPMLADALPDWQRVWDLQFQHNLFGEGVSWDPQAGYIAPPLDGIWASAPYLHNGAVPTLAEVLDSSARPDRWRHLDLEQGVYDVERVGWAYEIPALSKAEADADEAPTIYDTTVAGYGNGGHPFGDALSPAERAAVVEYLKTL